MKIFDFFCNFLILIIGVNPDFRPFRSFSYVSEMSANLRFFYFFYQYQSNIITYNFFVMLCNYFLVMFDINFVLSLTVSGISANLSFLKFSENFKQLSSTFLFFLKFLEVLIVVIYNKCEPQFSNCFALSLTFLR